MKPEKILELIKQRKNKRWERDNFRQERGDRLSAVVLSVLTDLPLCEEILQDLNAQIKQRTNIEQLSQAPQSFETVCLIQMPSVPDLADGNDAACLTAFEEILLENEHRLGVNLGRTTHTVPDFIGGVSNDFADKCVASDYLWNDCILNQSLFPHGRYSHRLQHYIFTKAVAMGRVDTSLLDGYLDLSRKGCVFKYLTATISQNVILTKQRLLQSHRQSSWHMTLESNLFEGDFTVFSELLMRDGKMIPCFAGPSYVTEYLLSLNAFKSLPYVSHAIYYSMYHMLLKVAQKAGMAPEEVFKLYVKSANTQVIAPVLEDPILDVIDELVEGHEVTIQPSGNVFDAPPIEELNLVLASKMLDNAKQNLNNGDMDLAMTQLTKALGDFEIGGRDSLASDAMVCIGDVRKQQGKQTQAYTAYAVGYNRKGLALPDDITLSSTPNKKLQL